jgi:hypothetical protein
MGKNKEGDEDSLIQLGEIDDWSIIS